MNPWERREDESPKAYAAFLAYLELGAERSIAKASGSTPGKQRWAEHWSSSFDWVARARAFDEHEAAERLAAREQLREQTRQAAVDAASQAMEVLISLMSFEDQERPSAGAKVRLEAAYKVLALAGVDGPRKLELSGPNGGSINLETSFEVRAMLVDAIDELGLSPELCLDLADKLSQRAESRPGSSQTALPMG
jgi:hypothetical protein